MSVFPLRRAPPPRIGRRTAVAQAPPVSVRAPVRPAPQLAPDAHGPGRALSVMGPVHARLGHPLSAGASSTGVRPRGPQDAVPAPAVVSGMLPATSNGHRDAGHDQQQNPRGLPRPAQHRGASPDQRSTPGPPLTSTRSAKPTTSAGTARPPTTSTVSTKPHDQRRHREASPDQRRWREAPRPVTGPRGLNDQQQGPRGCRRPADHGVAPPSPHAARAPLSSVHQESFDGVDTWREGARARPAAQERTGHAQAGTRGGPVGVSARYATLRRTEGRQGISSTPHSEGLPPTRRTPRSRARPRQRSVSCSCDRRRTAAADWM